jgi:LPXTG-site transpeptidase (sortase) family protein
MASQDPAPPAAPDNAAQPRAGEPAKRAQPAQPPVAQRQRSKGTPALTESAPVRIRIDKIGVSAAFVDLGIAADGTLEVPADPSKVGWYTGAHTPGAAGPAVVAGHVTWDQEPSVFFRLGELRAGDRVRIARADGSTATFAVQRVASFPKTRFPTQAVYRSGDRPVLRLITCGGTYDHGNHRYLDNTIVWAKLVGARSV